MQDSLLPESLGAVLKPNTKFYNWARTYRCEPKGTFYPTSDEQVQEIVKFCVNNNYSLRLIGSGHSPSDLCCVTENGYLMSLDKLCGIIHADKENGLVTVRAGTRMYDFHKEAREFGLAISCLGSISEQSLAGAISTATHGSGLEYGNLSSCVKSLTLITAENPDELITVDKDHDEHLFKASLCALGTTGVIVSLVVQCENDYNLQEEIWSMKVQDFINNILSNEHNKSLIKVGLAESAQHVRAWWFPQAGEVKVSRLQRTEMARTKAPMAIKSYIEDTFIGRHIHQLALFIGRYIPSLLQFHAKFLYYAIHKPRNFLFPIHQPTYPQPESSLDPSFPRCSPTYFRVGLSNDIFNFDCLFPQYTYEGAVPIDRAQECLNALNLWLENEYANPKGLRHHFPIEVRFAAADDVWLSPSYQKPVCYIGIVQYRPYGFSVAYRKLFAKFQTILLAHQGIPHWAKAHGLVKSDLVKLYPKLDEFNMVRERVDPKGIFLNPYTRRCLVGESGDYVEASQFESEEVIE